MKHKTILVWFRNDLRLHDNEMLYKAVRQAEVVIPVYCFDPRQLEEHPLGFRKTDAFRAQFLLESVADLRESLRKLGSDLVVRVGKPEEELFNLARQAEADAVFVAEEVTSEERKVERSLERKLTNAKIPMSRFWQQTLYHFDDLPYPLQSLPDVFTQFRKSVEKRIEVREPFAKPGTMSPHNLPGGELPSLSDLGLQPKRISEKAVLNFKGGEAEGIRRLNQYFWQGDHLKTYKNTRNGLLGADYSSKFSPWLSHGCLSPRFVYQEVKQYEKERYKNSSTYWLIFELIWRDYFRFVAKKFGNDLFKEGGLQRKRITMYDRSELFAKWANAETGVPFIDANMRELNATGFMSNRGRQNVASFLVKDLQVNWTWGAAYFESLLLDYDPCSNWGNWNYVAGVGNDPRENRYFNILSQAKRYDGKGEYVKHWLPELKDVPAQQVHMVGDLSRKDQEAHGVYLGGSYPYPMIDISRWMKKAY